MIDGLRYCPDLLSPKEQELVLEQIDANSWDDVLKRRTQHYGYRYDYKARSVNHSMWLGQLPPFAIAVSYKLKDRGLIENNPDQVIVNEYLPGQGISAHVDCEPCFADKIITVSLGWEYEMDFINVKTKESRSIMLEVGSALVMTGESRYDWMHRIKQRKKDYGIPRQRRVSLTFRRIIISK